MAHKSFAVIGLGQFGRSVVKELADNGMDVIAIDNDEETAKTVAAELPTTFIADSTDEKYKENLKRNSQIFLSEKSGLPAVRAIWSGK